MITALLFAWLGGSTVIQYQDHQAIKSLRSDNAALAERVDTHDIALQRHQKGLDYLYQQGKYQTPSKGHWEAPKASWMENL